MKRKGEKAGLKLNIQKTKIMASSPITSWQIDGETMETVTDFILGVPESLQMAPGLSHGIAPLGCSCAVTAWHSWPPPLTSDVG